METVGSHKIHIEGRWEIRDLYLFPHRYAEIYSFLYALSTAEKSEANLFAQAFKRYPWQGGYSAVNFYDELYGAIPRQERPRIKRIEYASPGYIELGAVILLVTQIDKILTTAFKTWDKLDRIYDGIHKRYVRRRLAKINLRDRERKLSEDDLKFTVEACKELSEAIGLENPAALNKLTGDPLASLKILMAFYRRLRETVYFIHEGKVSITRGSEKQQDDTKRITRKFDLDDE
ncbi:MAG: hypothetical protein HOP33_12195 [Verrucomicrobia bacterium]|nr:hypothetical protein [Verrucomicrobiota bacterium]